MALMADDYAELSRAIGKLEGSLEALIRQGEDAQESRKKLYESAERTRAEVSDLIKRLDTVETTVKGMDPLVQEFGRLKQRGLGVLMVLSLVWLMLGGLVVQALGWAVGWLLRSLGQGG